MRFYWIEYAWKKGNKAKRGDFSPDFFIKQGSRSFVVEIKGDEEIADPAVENQKKYEYAVSHFERLNLWLAKERAPIRYQLNFLSPRSYNRFFQLMRKDDLAGFRWELDVALAKVEDSNSSPAQ